MKLKKFNVQKKNGKYFGYKVFKTENHLYYPVYHAVLNGFKTRKWYEDSSDYMISMTHRREYKSGFHIFTRKRGAINFQKYCMKRTTIRKVEFKDIVAIGSQVASIYPSAEKIARVVVVKKMKIL
jgi:hypothetical protein